MIFSFVNIFRRELIKLSFWVLLLLLFSSLFLSCKETSTGDKVVCTVGSNKILLSEVDGIAKQEIFDELNRIYLIREAALRNLIFDNLIKLEAKKRGVTDSVFLDSYVEKHCTR